MSAATINPREHTAIPYGRTCKPGGIPITITVNSAYLARLRAVAARRNTTAGELIRFLVAEHIDLLEEAAEADEQRRMP